MAPSIARFLRAKLKPLQLHADPVAPMSCTVSVGNGLMSVGFRDIDSGRAVRLLIPLQQWPGLARAMSQHEAVATIRRRREWENVAGKPAHFPKDRLLTVAQALALIDSAADALEDLAGATGEQDLSELRTLAVAWLGSERFEALAHDPVAICTALTIHVLNSRTDGELTNLTAPEA